MPTIGGSPPWPYGTPSVVARDRLGHDAGMEIWPAAGTTGDRLLGVLDYMHQTATNFAAGAHDVAGRLRAYLQWGADVQRMAYGVLTNEDLERLALSRRYWAVTQNPDPTPEVASAIGEEMAARKSDLDSARYALRATLESWNHSSGRDDCAILIADTNILMKQDHRASDFDWHSLVSQHVRTMTPLTVVVPIAVVDELENLKRGNGEVRTNARYALKYLAQHLGALPANSTRLKGETEERASVDLRLLIDPKRHERLPIMDDEIIDRAVALRDLLGRSTVFVTYDTAAAFRASAAGLKVQLLQEDE